MNFSNDALLAAAAAIVAGRLQSRAAREVNGATADNVSEMLAQAMAEVLGGVDLMEERAKSESMDTWQRLSGE
ncbi:hypothetical protein [Ideonella sp.]|uniref:hypothetical protein n=1 Tax=Ideonella sp. TaxID=1929293 RepID=UPI0035AEBAD7